MHLPSRLSRNWEVAIENTKVIWQCDVGEVQFTCSASFCLLLHFILLHCILLCIKFYYCSLKLEVQKVECSCKKCGVIICNCIHDGVVTPS